MSDTTYVHEVTRERKFRVALTMDADEARAVANVAAAAIDASVMVEGTTSSVVLRNAEAVYRWATRAADTLDDAMGAATQAASDEE